MLRAIRILLIGPPSDRFRATFRAMVALRERGYHRLARLLSFRLQAYGVHIAPKARVPASLIFPHPTGIVIGEGVVIEDDVTIYQSVTLGGRNTGAWRTDNYPTVGAGTVIFAGAVLIGRITVGKNCTIGANSVVTQDIPDNLTAVGAPARIVVAQKILTKSADL